MSFQGNKDVRVQGSSISLAPTGVTAGTYNQVQVDANGRVTAGGGGSGTPVSGTVTVALSGDASGSASGSGANPTITVPATLATVNSNVGTFQGITVNAKGLVTAAVNQGYLTGNQTITLSGYATGSGTTSISVTVGKVQGVTNGSNAAAGDVGEYISSSVVNASAVSLSSTVSKDVTSISLTAGDWDVEGLVANQPGATTTVTAYVYSWVNNVSATAQTADLGGIALVAITNSPANETFLPTGTRRFSLSTTTTIYLSTNQSFSGGGMSAYGVIRARRVR